MGTPTFISWWFMSTPAEARPAGARPTRVAQTPTTTPRAPIRPTPSPGVRETGTEYIEGSPYLPTGPQLLPSTPANPSSPIDDLEALPLPPGRIDWEEDPQFSFMARELFPEQYRALKTLGEVKGIVSDIILQEAPLVSSLPGSAHLIIPEGVYDNAWDIFSDRNQWVWDKEALWVSNSQQRWEALVLAMESYLERRKEGYSLALEYEEKTKGIPVTPDRLGYTLGDYGIEYRYDEVVEIPGSRETIEEILFPSIEEEENKVEGEEDDWLEKLFPPECDPDDPHKEENPLPSTVASADESEEVPAEEAEECESNPVDDLPSPLREAVQNFSTAMVIHESGPDSHSTREVRRKRMVLAALKSEDNIAALEAALPQAEEEVARLERREREDQGDDEFILVMQLEDARRDRDIILRALGLFAQLEGTEGAPFSPREAIPGGEASVDFRKLAADLIYRRQLEEDAPRALRDAEAEEERTRGMPDIHTDSWVELATARQVNLDAQSNREAAEEAFIDFLLEGTTAEAALDHYQGELDAALAAERRARRLRHEGRITPEDATRFTRYREAVREAVEMLRRTIQTFDHLVVQLASNWQTYQDNPDSPTTEALLATTRKLATFTRERLEVALETEPDAIRQLLAILPNPILEREEEFDQGRVNTVIEHIDRAFQRRNNARDRLAQLATDGEEETLRGAQRDLEIAETQFDDFAAFEILEELQTALRYIRQTLPDERSDTMWRGSLAIPELIDTLIRSNDGGFDLDGGPSTDELLFPDGS